MIQYFFNNFNNLFFIFWVFDRYLSVSRIIIFSNFGYIYFFLQNKIFLIYYNKGLFIINLTYLYKNMSLIYLINFNFISYIYLIYNFYKIELNIIGVGFKVYFEKKFLNFKIGFSHKISIKVSKNINVIIFNKGTNLILKSINKIFLGNVVFFIKNLKLLNKYKSKGILYTYEILKLKKKKNDIFI